MFRFDLVAFDRLFGIQIDGMEIEAFGAGDQLERLVEVGAEFFGIAGAARIVAGGKDAA